MPECSGKKLVAGSSPGFSDEIDAQRTLVLASASPRRAELLGWLGLEFEVKPANIPEDPLPGEAPWDLVKRLSAEKARAVADGMRSGFVVGADSMVVLEGQAYGKPAGAAEARWMLQRLRSTRHQVYTGLTVVDAGFNRTVTDALSSDVVLRDIRDWEIERSIKSGMPFDKAGAYAIQDTQLKPAESWQGCYSNIVGLPLCRLAENLEELGFPLPSCSAMGAVTGNAGGCTGSCPFRVDSLGGGLP